MSYRKESWFRTAAVQAFEQIRSINLAGVQHSQKLDRVQTHAFANHKPSIGLQ